MASAKSGAYKNCEYDYWQPPTKPHHVAGLELQPHIAAHLRQEGEHVGVQPVALRLRVCSEREIADASTHESKVSTECQTGVGVGIDRTMFEDYTYIGRRTPRSRGASRDAAAPKHGKGWLHVRQRLSLRTRRWGVGRRVGAITPYADN